MAEILIAGAADFESRLASELKSRLPGISLTTLAGAELALDPLEPAGLLILEHRASGPDTVGFIAQLRQRFPELPVIYCLDPDAEGKLVRRLILELQVNELLFNPVGGDVLAERAAALLGLPRESVADPDANSTPASGPQAALKSKLAAVWKRSRSRMLARLDVLDQASVRPLGGRLDLTLRKQAESAAHKLAGSLGTFGLEAGSRFAREMEDLLRSNSLTSEARARRFSELAAALRVEIESAPVSEGFPQQTSSEPGLRSALLVACDPELEARLGEEAAAHGWHWESACDMAAARETLPVLNPSAVLMDVDTPARAAEAIGFLSGLSERQPPLPALILTSDSSLMDRVELVRRGARGFIPRTLPAEEIVRAVTDLVGRADASVPRVLAVDDDPGVLEALGVLLASSGIRLTAVGDPLRLWDALRGPPPDLLLLDIQMPVVSGLELCRLVRSDPRWAGIPIIFLTALLDAPTVQRAFASGGDDYVVKPIVGPELLTRITNRLERVRLTRRLADIDPLSGLATGLKSRRLLQDFLRLADRHSQSLGFALLGVDRLEEINGEHGPAAGDDVLRALGRDLCREFHSQEVSRWNGNDFVLGFYGLDWQESVRRIEGIVHSFAARTFVSADAAEFHVTLSAGVAVYPEDAGDLHGLWAAANEARRQARFEGGHSIRLPESSAVADVAVVTGDEPAAALLLHALKSLGYRVRTLRDGLRAARALSGSARSLRARALVLDAELPGLDGLTLLKQLKDDGVLDTTRAILLTSATAAHEAVTALELGAEECVAKPFDVPVLVERVRRVLESPRLARS